MRDLLPYGYQISNGATLPDSCVDSYNAVQERINSFMAVNRPVPDYLINGSFNLMNSFHEAYRGETQ